MKRKARKRDGKWNDKGGIVEKGWLILLGLHIIYFYYFIFS